jgi:hypothetical protein
MNGFENELGKDNTPLEKERSKILEKRQEYYLMKLESLKK